MTRKASRLKSQLRDISTSTVALAAGAWAAACFAAPGDLDTSFGNGGVASLEFLPAASLSFSAIALQPDGKLLLAGALDEDMLVVRLNALGAPDASFGGGDGIVTIDFAGGSDDAAALSVLSDGRIVVGGSAAPAGEERSLAVARLDADGLLDSTFGVGGRATVSQAVGITGYRLVVQSDGKVALAGTSNADPSTFKFARFNANGTPDISFGGGGIATFTFASSASEVGAFLQQPDGALLAVGTVNIGDLLERDDNIVVMRLAANGGFDPTFGAAGKVELDYPTVDNFDLANAAVLLPDGRILIAGSIATLNTPRHSQLLRLNPDGTLDDDFGLQGVRAHRLAAHDEISSAGLSADESTLLVAGTTRHWIEQSTGAATSYDQPFLSRMNLQGDLDTSFGDDGVSRIGLDCRISPELAIQADGALIIACRAAQPTTIKIARLMSGAGDSAGLLGLSKSAFQGSSGGTCESCESVTLLATRTGGRAGAVSVNYRTVDGTATAGADYSLISGTLSWADGEDDDKELIVPILSDTAHEGGPDNDAETLLVELHDPSGLAPIAIASTEISITEDDDGTVGTVAAFSSGRAADETDGTATTWATRSGGSTGAISVNWSTSSASATSGADFTAASGSLSWADGESAPKPITVELIDDSNEELGEVFDIDITAGSGGVNVFPTDVFFHVAIEDDDNRLYSGGGGGTPTPGIIGFSSTTANVSENAGNLSISVARSNGSAGAVTVDYSTANGTAAAGTDYANTSGTLSWADGEGGSKNIVVAITDDTIAESAETFTVTLSNATGGASIGTNVFTVSIPANDSSGGGGGGGGGGGAMNLTTLLAMLALAFRGRRRSPPRVMRGKTLRPLAYFSVRLVKTEMSLQSANYRN